MDNSKAEKELQEIMKILRVNDRMQNRKNFNMTFEGIFAGYQPISYDGTWCLAWGVLPFMYDRNDGNMDHTGVVIALFGEHPYDLICSFANCRTLAIGLFDYQDMMT